MKVEMVNTTFCKCSDAEARRKLSKLLRYKYTWFTRGKYAKVKHSRLFSFVDESSGFFLSGFLPRVLRKYPTLQIKNNSVQSVLKPDRYSFKNAECSLPGITYRPDQIGAIAAALDRQRGVIKFATASGKTVIGAGAIKGFNAQAVFLAHRKEIVTQSYERFLQYGLDTGVLTGNKKKQLSAQVLCASIQSYYNAINAGKVPPPKVAVIDECHHVQDLEGQYGKLLGTLQIPVIIGLTGTRPNSRYGRMCMEGLVGPVIARLSIKEGIEKKIISKPKITLLPVPKLGSISKLKSYYEIRDLGIVYNVVRNKLIMAEAKKRVDAGKSCLIIVNEIKHGEKLVKAAGVFEAVFLQGKTASKIREQVKQALITKTSFCVITTNIWGEGVDIPTLDVVIIAFGGKANTRTLQTLGRVLRTADGKDSAELIDFLDPYKFLAEHLVHRLTIYKKEGLM